METLEEVRVKSAKPGAALTFVGQWLHLEHQLLQLLDLCTYMTRELSGNVDVQSVCGAGRCSHADLCSGVCGGLLKLCCVLSAGLAIQPVTSPLSLALHSPGLLRRGQPPCSSNCWQTWPETGPEAAQPPRLLLWPSPICYPAADRPALRVSPRCVGAAAAVGTEASAAAIAAAGAACGLCSACSCCCPRCWGCAAVCVLGAGWQGSSMAPV